MDRMQPAARRAVNEDWFEYPDAYAVTARAVMLIFGEIAILAVFVLTSLYASRLAAFLAALPFALPVIALSIILSCVAGDCLAPRMRRRAPGRQSQS